MTELEEMNGTRQRRDPVMPEFPADAKVVETAIAWNWMGGDRILRVVVKPDVEIGRAEAEESVAVGRGMVGTEPYAMLVDTGSIRRMDRAARDCFTRHGAQDNPALGVAIVVRTPLARMIGNFFIGFNRPQRPVRLFTACDEAERWLTGLLAGKNGNG
jgi:hypothetical protein